MGTCSAKYLQFTLLHWKVNTLLAVWRDYSHIWIKMILQKAIMESDEEWSMNKKLIDLSSKDIRKSVSNEMYWTLNFSANYFRLFWLLTVSKREERENN